MSEHRHADNIAKVRRYDDDTDTEDDVPLAVPARRKISAVPLRKFPRSFVHEDYANLFVNRSQVEIIKQISAIRDIKCVPSGVQLRGAALYHGMFIARYIIPYYNGMDTHVLHGFECGPDAKPVLTTVTLPTTYPGGLFITEEFSRLVHDRSGMTLTTKGGNDPSGIVSTTMIAMF